MSNNAEITDGHLFEQAVTTDTDGEGRQYWELETPTADLWSYKKETLVQWLRQAADKVERMA